MDTPALNRIEKDRYGASAFPSDFTFAEYASAILEASDKEDESKWVAADAFLDVERRWGEDAALNLPKPQKLTEAAWMNRLSITRKFPATRRRAYGISYVSFYEVVRTLPDELIDKLLTMARDGEWTRTELVEAKKAVPRPCPKCGKTMVKVGEEWVCLTCEHRMKITADTPKAAKAKGVLEVVGNSYRVNIADYLPAGYEDGIEVQVTFKRIDKVAA